LTLNNLDEVTKTIYDLLEKTEVIQEGN